MSAVAESPLDHITKSGQYACRPHVEIFTEHEIKRRDGSIARKVTKDNLLQTAQVGNAKVAKGCLSPGGLGHTADDQFDDKGNLIQKFPEEKQPRPLTYYANYRVEWNPKSAKYSLYADEWVQKRIKDPETGETVDGMQYTATFPRRSAEIYHDDHWIDWVALIRRAPRLDLALELYSKADQEHTLYTRMDDKDIPVCVMAKKKHRYSYATGETMDVADAPPKPATGEPSDPTKPPTATPAPAHGQEPPIEQELPEEHRHAAEMYSKHLFGRPHEHTRKLMDHLHGKYGMECGLGGGSPTAEPAAGPAAPAADYAMISGTSVQPAAKPPHSTEHQKMQQDQAALEHTRYERRIADLETKAQAADARELETHMRYEFMQMVGEGFPINGANEMKICQDRRYSREQVNNYVADLRRVLGGHKAPIDDLPPLDLGNPGLGRTFQTGGPAKDPMEDPQEFDKCQRYMRQSGCSWSEAKERYSKGAA